MAIYQHPDNVSAETKTKLAELHNKAAGEIVKSIVRPILDLGGTEGDAMVTLESIVVGVLLTMDPRGDGARLTMLLGNVGARLGKVRADNRKRAAH